MNILQLVSTVDKTDPRLQANPEWEQIANCFGIHQCFYSEDPRLKCFYVTVWNCTDQWVGISAYFLDDEFVAVSSKDGRKSDSSFEFVKEKKEILRQYLLSLVFAESEEVTELDVEKDLGEDYSLAYGSQLLHWFHRFGKLGEDVVEIVAVEWNGYKFFDLVDIVHNGERREESLKNIKFRLGVFYPDAPRFENKVK